MTYPNAIVCAAALIAGALLISAEARSDRPQGQEIRAVAGGELIWWLEPSAQGPRVAACAWDGREIECTSKVLAEEE
ncbi:MAG: hypothetical protein MI920_28880 [Kiloniellales bacterium]|nr:hypothetical protein [Kiloniellales bacterium]